jgi:regulation of enolase protein 1 (concanavalin A-like superfamily)
MALLPLHESFAAPALHPDLRWFCEPARWALLSAERRLRVEPDAGTDFWQRTHYGFQADNGHFLFTRVAGDFLLTTHVAFRPAHQYDQAGLMVRLSPSCWLKTSVEHEPDGPGRLGVVVTNAAYSDWSTQDFPSGPGQVWLRVRRQRGAYLVEGSRDGAVWSQLRLAQLHEDQDGSAVCCGLYACSPKGAGLVAEFSFLHIDPGAAPHA